MKAKAVPSKWLESDGRRLDCGPYMSGALEARIRLEQLSVRKDPLYEVTLDGHAGIFNGPRFPRKYVNDPRFGVPFLGSTDILASDLTHLPLISRKQVEALPELVIRPSWTLITCSGTVGRMAFARSDMDGMAGSQHFMRVVPDPAKIPAGYLYAYLSSKFGVPLIVGGTYGAIIQHIEPEHVADLPVPRLGTGVENRVHALVEEAANLRVKASRSLREAIEEVERTLRVPEEEREPSAESVGHDISSGTLAKELRFEGFYYNPSALRADQWADNHPNGYRVLGDVSDVFDVPQFKHIYVDAAHGVPFFTSGDLFNLGRQPDKYLSRTRTKNLDLYILKRGWVLLARSGQLGGILGRPEFTDSALEGAATSDHVIRIVAREDSIPAGYLYAYLATSVGYVLITRTMTGASIPALWPKFLQRIRVISPTNDFASEIHERVIGAFEQRAKATEAEKAAVALVERTIERVH